MDLSEWIQIACTHRILYYFFRAQISFRLHLHGAFSEVIAAGDLYMDARGHILVGVFEMLWSYHPAIGMAQTLP